MRAVGADVVVGDIRQSLAISARQAGIPFNNHIDAQLSPSAAMDIEMARPAWMPRLPAEVDAALKAMLHPPAHFLMTLPANLARMRHGIDGWHQDAREVYGAGDYVLYPDVPEIVPIADLPPQHRYIGPIRWSPSVALPPWWNDLPRGRPVVFVNISASSPRHLLPASLEALAHMPVTVIAAGTGEVPRGGNGKLFMADILPGRAAAERADLTICNGGNMSVQQSLLAGTPVLCLPHYAEQLMYSRAIAATGAGTRIDPSEVGAEAIRRRVTAMLNEPSHRDAARRLARIMDRYDAGAELAGLIDAILAERAA
jgi:UDP:flavonoid glycosyltransferase YjiC (YdhE family)